MKKCLLWGMGICFQNYVNVVKYHEILNHFEVVGVTSNDYIYSKVRGYNCIKKEDLNKIEFDILIVMADGNVCKEIIKEALDLGIAKETIFTYNSLLYQNFEIDRYINLKKNPPSIFSINCWGGITYHSLGLEFTSPLIDLSLRGDDYLKLLKNPKFYMNEELELVDYGRNINYSKIINYPIAKCGDIRLHFHHYESFEGANQCWERRKQRINWNNLFIMMYTEDPVFAKQFTTLPYEKKICFVPFNSEDESLIYIELQKKYELEKLPFWKIVNGMAKGTYPYYDVFELLENGKIVKTVEI